MPVDTETGASAIVAEGARERPLRIGFLTPEYPTQRYTGGIGSYVRQMASSLADLGHAPFVLLSDSSEEEEVTFDGVIPVYRFHLSALAARLPWPLGGDASIAFARAVAAMSKKLRLDVLEAPEWLGLTAFLHLTKPKDLRVVVRLHTCSAIIRKVNKLRAASFRENLAWRRTDAVEKLAISTADVVTACSKAIGAQTTKALSFSKRDFKVVPNSVHDSAFSPIGNIGSNVSPVVLFVGRLEWRKGPDLLMRAVPEVLKRCPDTLFRLAGVDTATAPGGGSMGAYLMGLLPHNARSHVEFCGHLTAPQLEDAVRQATICVFPSRYEGLPMVCLEAMARGKAIVATDILGFSELLSNAETGIIVKAEDPEALSDALIQLINNPVLRDGLGTAARERARSNFHATVIAKSMLQVYRSSMKDVESRSKTGSFEGHERQ